MEGIEEVPPPDPYKYKSLDNAHKQIRLLQITKDEHGAIQYYLAPFEMDLAPRYVALSYTWGKAAPTFEIAVNGNQQLEIRSNLYNFLQEYRVEGYMWIDQICINQASLEERSSQVQLMSEIYRNASHVVAWLHLSSTISDPQAAQMEASLESVKTMAELIQDDYFTRLWVVQEILLAQSVYILLKSVLIPWNDLRKALGSIHVHRTVFDFQRKRLGLNQPRYGVDPPGAVMVLLDNYRKSSFSLAEAITTFCKSDCDDPRDKVYGMLGLVNEEDKIKADYTKSTYEIFADVIVVLASAYATSKTRKIVVQSSHARERHPVSSLQDYAWSLYLLSEEMKFYISEVKALRIMLRHIWRPETFKSSTEAELASLSPVPAAGFEKRRTGTSEAQSYELEVAEMKDRWWYEHKGQRRYFDC